MREILFRAKTEPNCKDVITGKIIKNPKWIYGYVDLGYMHDCKSPLISDEKGNKTYKCQYETIGQFTGLTDKNGKRIFEGDVVRDIFLNSKKIYVVKFTTDCNCGFEPFCEQVYGGEMLLEPKDCEVIGNIHDNPELLEPQKGE